MKQFVPHKILIEKNIRAHPLTRSILKQFPAVPAASIDDCAALPAGTNSSTLILAKHKGAFIVPCPGTPGYMCCNYHIIDSGFGCTFNCTYCFLHHYRNTPGIILYVNLRDALHTITRLARANKTFFKRIGTGEFTDSLLLDHISGHSTMLVEYCAHTNYILELKTKSANIENLKGLRHNNHTVLAWSLNPAHITREEEPAAASLRERLQAAHLMQQEGYPLAFHIDPIIYSRSWEQEYHGLIQQLRSAVKPAAVMWISLGTLRFNPGMKPLIQRYFPRSRIIYEEMIKGLDGKLRYVQPIRIEIYATMSRWIKKAFPETPLYLCMESLTVWEQALGWKPKNNIDLETYILSRIQPHAVL
jgi:spore photoproduct lyase